jgi:predicted RNA-binding protein YlqC (UPF0109 family)
MELLQKIQVQLDVANADVEKFVEKGNKAAGKRIRAAMQEIKKLAQEFRVKVSEMKNQD